jgi:hypothetical protein
MGGPFDRFLSLYRSSAFARMSRLHRHPFLRALLDEFRSLVGRIHILRTTRLYHYGVDLGQGLKRLPNGHLTRNTRTVSCSLDTKTLLAIHPKASLVDLKIFLAGWDKGAEWVLDNSDSCNGLQVQDALNTSAKNQKAAL